MQEPRWRRRSAERPAEIIAAAAAEFAEQGFAAARMSAIAARAGVSKAALYRYFPAKDALFRAVVQQEGPDVEALAGALGRQEVRTVVPALLSVMAQVLERPEVRQLALMVVAESSRFPELAVVWREQVIDPVLDGLRRCLELGQAEGTVRPGEARYMALCIAGPMLMGAIWRQVVEPAGGAPISLADLAAVHAQVALGGLLLDDQAGSPRA